MDLNYLHTNKHWYLPVYSGRETEGKIGFIRQIIYSNWEKAKGRVKVLSKIKIRFEKPESFI